MKTNTPKETQQLLKKYRQFLKRRWKQKEQNWREHLISFPLIQTLAADHIYTNNQNQLLSQPLIKEEGNNYLY